MQKTFPILLTAAALLAPTIAERYKSDRPAPDRLVRGLASRQLSLRDRVGTMVSQLRGFSSANAGDATYTSNVINKIRFAYGENLGFSETSYTQLVCTGGGASICAQNEVPEAGIVGTVTPFIAGLRTVAENAGVTSCTAIPSSGTATGNDVDGNSVTLHFETPTHSVPADWLTGGTSFQKRVTLDESIEGTTVKFAVEFNCGDSGATYTAVNMPIDNGTCGGGGHNCSGNGFTRYISFFTGDVSSSVKGFDVYLVEGLKNGQAPAASANRTDSLVGPLVRGVDAVRIEYAPSTTQFKLWGILTAGVSSGSLVGRAIVTGNYASGAASVLFDGFVQSQLAGADGNIDVSSLEAGLAGSAETSADLDTLTSGVSAFDLAADLNSTSSGTLLQKQGCINFTTPDTGPASTATCAGLALTAPNAAPYIDASGKFSVHWALSTLVGKMESL